MPNYNRVDSTRASTGFETWLADQGAARSAGAERSALKQQQLG